MGILGVMVTATVEEKTYFVIQGEQDLFRGMLHM